MTDKPKGFVIQPVDPVWGTDDDTDLHIALVHPEIPGNTGNIGRLCAGSNIWLHLVKPFGFELSNKYLRRAGLDYWPHVRLCVHESFDDFASIFPRDRLVMLTKKATNIYADVAYEPGHVLVFGCETKGLSDEILNAFEDRLVRIPTTGSVRSLNLSNACAVVVYEAMRQLAWTPLKTQ